MKWVNTPQGYKISKAVITRAGAFIYKGSDLGLTDERMNQQVKLYRNIEDLSNSKTLSSFEGMDLTMTHPPSSKITAEDWSDKAIGHIQNVRVENDLIVCDAYIKDKSAIDLLSDKAELRELSVGYEDNPTIEERNGKFYHKNIIGNHVAVVVEGRAGHDCRLLIDHKGVDLMNIKDLIKMLTGKRLNDSADVTLTADEINQMIESLEAARKELEGDESEEAKAKIAEITAQLEELKTKVTAVTPNDEVDPINESSQTETAKLIAENEALKIENAQLKAKIEELNNEKTTNNALNDARQSFPKVNFNEVKTERDVYSKVLTDAEIFNNEAIKALTDSDIRSAYIAYRATAKNKQSNVGKVLLSDSKLSTLSAQSRLGGN